MSRCRPGPAHCWLNRGPVRRAPTGRAVEFQGALAHRRWRVVRLDIRSQPIGMDCLGMVTGQHLLDSRDKRARVLGRDEQLRSDIAQDFLKAADTEEVRLEFKDPQSAGQLRPEGADDYKYRYIVMPMRI